MPRLTELMMASRAKRQLGVIKYPTGKFGFVGSDIPYELAKNTDGSTRVFISEAEAWAAYGENSND